MRAAVIVVTYNHAAIISACLSAVRSTAPEETEVLVVDNASVDGTVDVVRQEHPSVRVVEAAANVGYGGGNNLGAAHVPPNVEVLVFLNPDAVPRPGWLEPLLAPLAADLSVGLATPKLLLARDPTLIDTLGNDVHLSGITPSRKWGEPAGAHTEPEEVSAISGACFAIRRELFVKLGGFDERYFLYYEDTDLSLRARLAGYRCLAVPASEVVHDHRPGFSAEKLRYLERNRYWTLLKLLQPRTLVALLPTLVLSEVLAWGMAVMSGPRHTAAKALAWWDLVAWLPDLHMARAHGQRLRTRADIDLLPLHSTYLRFGQAAAGPLESAGERAMGVAFALTRAFTELALTGRTRRPRARRARRAGLRIAIVTATFPPYRGGTGNVAWHNAREVARLGHDVHVFTAANGDAADQDPGDPEGVAVHRLRPLVAIGNAPLLLGLVGALRRFDLIHLHYPFFFGAELVWLVSRIFGVPYVVTYHQDVLLSGLTRWVPPVHHSLVGQRILSDASRLLFTTRSYGRGSFARSLVDGATSRALPNAVDVRRFSPAVDGSAVRHALCATDSQMLVLFVASLDRAHHFKGLNVLLRALAELREEYPQLRLAIVGDGDLRASYEQAARTLGLDELVGFAGRVSDDDLPCYYAACDVLVLPSVTRGEAFGLVLLEAMATGRPVIASDLPGVRDVVSDTGGGLLVPPGDAAALAAALRYLADAPTERDALGAAGRAAVETRYSWASIGPQLECIYRAVLTCH